MSATGLDPRQTFEDKSIVVTGGGSGIGLAVATQLSTAGALVTIGDLAAPSGALGERITALRCDVSDSSQVDALFRDVRNRIGRLDGVVNVAGVSGAPLPVAEIDDEEFDRVLAVNLKGTFYSMRSAIPLIRETGGGSIVNVSSIAADVVFPLQGAYSASKGAINSLTRSAAGECASAGIRVNAVHPGLVDTPMYRASATDDTDRYIASRTPAGRIGVPHDIAAAVLFLLSEQSSFITGATLRVDGGWALG